MASCFQTGISPYVRLLILVAFVVVYRVGCLGVTGVVLAMVITKISRVPRVGCGAPKKHLISQLGQQKNIYAIQFSLFFFI